MKRDSDVLKIDDAIIWIRQKFNRKVSFAEIVQLTKSGQIPATYEKEEIRINKSDLDRYFSNQSRLEVEWKKILGEDLNWHLSFDKIKEYDRTKHVHRLHPYKGKFIPQLVEYFLNDQTDNFKKDVYFRAGDTVLDPFCGSGTTLVQANELSINALGIDISYFNSLISNVKVGKHNIDEIKKEIKRITSGLRSFIRENRWSAFERELLAELYRFNNKYFPAPNFRYRVQQGEIDHKSYGKSKEQIFKPIFDSLVSKHGIQVAQANNPDSFLDKWFLDPVRREIDYIYKLVEEVQDTDTKNVIKVILSRTIRSCRATTHYDLATLENVIYHPYYCQKHYKICKPLFSISYWWETYTGDTINRLMKFNAIRTNTFQYCLTGDSRDINILHELRKANIDFYQIVKDRKIQGIFSSPPYVGLIDYHEQHAYAYDLFGFERRDDLEIGSLLKGRGWQSRNLYVNEISNVLNNCKRFLAENFNIFLVANDKYDLYPRIASKAGLVIVKKFRRPVLFRTEKVKSAYAESIFHLKENKKTNSF